MKSIQYVILIEKNRGTEEKPVVEQVFRNKEIRCSDEYFESNYAVAQKEAYSEITVEEIEGEETPPSQLDQLEAQVTYTAMMTDTLLEV